MNRVSQVLSRGTPRPLQSSGQGSSAVRTAARIRADLARGFASNSAFEDVNDRELMIWKLGGRIDSIDAGM